VVRLVLALAVKHYVLGPSYIVLLTAVNTLKLADFLKLRLVQIFFCSQLQYADISTETFCGGDVLLQETFCYGEVMLRRRFVWRHFVEETFCAETFCMCTHLLPML
jgi:hypothetical protein